MQQLAAVENRKPVGERLRIGQLVRHQDGRHLPLVDQPDHQVGEHPPQGGVQPAVGLIQQQRLAVREQQPPESHPVRLPAGQPRGHRRQQSPDPQRVGKLSQLGAAAVRRRPVAEVGAHGQMREETRVLAQHADPALPWRHRPHGRRSGRQHPAIERNLTASQRHQPGDGFQDRGLAGARRAEQGQPLPRRNRHGGAHGEVPAVNLDVGVQHGRSRCRRPAAVAARPPAGPARTAGRRPSRSPAAWCRSATVSRMDGRR